MASAACTSPIPAYCGCLVRLIRQPEAVSCVLASGATVLLPCLLAGHIAIGDEITFAIPAGDAVGTEIYVTKAISSRIGNSLYLAPIGYVTQPKQDKRGQSFVSAQVQNGTLGISCVFLLCDTVSEYFYGSGDPKNGSVSATLYQTLRIGSAASLAEIRVAFKLRALELQTIGAGRAEHVKLERAFNIVGHPELRAHYDSLLSDPELPAIFPYGGVGSLLVVGERSRSSATFFAHRILAFVPDKAHRKFQLPLRYCEFCSDKILCRDVRRKLQFWLDPALMHAAWDPSWNRWKHLLNSKIEVEGAFVRGRKYKKRGDDWKAVDWETGLPSRLSVKLPADFAQDIEGARNTYCRFGQYSRALDQIRLCLEHKAIERKDLERMCSQLGIPGDFDVAQISWRPDYNSFFYSELSRRARQIYLFRDEYVFEVERAIVVETPQLGHASYVFAKPRSMESFLALYTKISKEHIRRNRENVGERLGFLGRVIHGTNPKAWLNEMRQRLGEKIKSASVVAD